MNFIVETFHFDRKLNSQTYRLDKIRLTKANYQNIFIPDGIEPGPSDLNQDIYHRAKSNRAKFVSRNVIMQMSLGQQSLDKRSPKKK